MRSPSPSPTLVDVARAAGVSRATASRVLAGQTTVDPELAARVLDAAERLDYRTNTAARALRSGSTGSVAVVVPNSELDGLSGPFVGAPLRGATTTLFAHGRQPVLLLDDGLATGQLLRYLTGPHVDGAVVILHHETETLFRRLHGVTVPVVYVGRTSDELAADASFVDCDNYGGARAATRALLEAGRRRLATIAGPSTYRPVTERLRGFVDELADWGLAPGPVVHGEFSMAAGAAAAAQLLQRTTVDAVFAQSDLLAVGAVRVVTSAGRRVPDDVSVVAFDDTVVAATSDPPLSSVRQPLYEMGARAAELLLEAIGGTSTGPQQDTLPTSLTTRASV